MSWQVAASRKNKFYPNFITEGDFLWVEFLPKKPPKHQVILVHC